MSLFIVFKMPSNLDPVLLPKHFHMYKLGYCHGYLLLFNYFLIRSRIQTYSVSTFIFIYLYYSVLLLFIILCYFSTCIWFMMWQVHLCLALANSSTRFVLIVCFICLFRFQFDYGVNGFSVEVQFLFTLCFFIAVYLAGTRKFSLVVLSSLYLLHFLLSVRIQFLILFLSHNL